MEVLLFFNVSPVNLINQPARLVCLILLAPSALGESLAYIALF